VDKFNIRPAEIAEHHFAGEHDRTGVDHVLIGVFGRGAVRGLEDGVAGDVIDIAAGRDADAADLRSQGIAQIIAVKVERGDDVEIRRAREHLLERDVGDGVLDDDARTGLAGGDLAPRPLVNRHRAELGFGQLVGPVAEGALGVFHDVALVDNRHALAVVGDGVLEGGADEPLRAGFGNRLDANADELGRVAEADFFEILGKVRLEKFNRLERGFLARLEINAGVNILGVFAEDDHVHLFGMFHGRGDAGEPLHGAQADVEIEHLAQRDVERADAAADGRGERALDADEIFLERGHGVVREPVVEFVLGGFAGKNLEPGNFPLAGVGLGHRGIEHADAGGPDVRAGAVAADERDDGVVRHVEFAVFNVNFFAGGDGASGVGHD
jgi:hypothetical protein